MTDTIKSDDTAHSSETTDTGAANDVKIETSDNDKKEATVPSGRLKEEADKRRAAEAKNIEYEKAEAERAEAKKVEQGKYEELLTEYKGKVAELTKTNEDLLSFKDTVLESTKVEVEKMKENIPEGHKDFLNKALEGRDPLQQAELLREALPTWNTTEVKSTPKKSGSGAKSIDAWEEAKKKGDIAGMLKAGRNK